MATKVIDRERMAELRQQRDLYLLGANQWIHDKPGPAGELARLQELQYEQENACEIPWNNLRESNLTEFVDDCESDTVSGRLLFDGCEIGELRRFDHPMWADLFAAAPGMFAAMLRLLNSPDLNEDSLSPETIKAIDDANHVLDRVRKGRRTNATYVSVMEKGFKLAQAEAVRAVATSLLLNAMLIDDPTRPGTDAYLVPLSDIDEARKVLGIS